MLPTWKSPVKISPRRQSAGPWHKWGPLPPLLLPQWDGHHFLCSRRIRPSFEVSPGLLLCVFALLESMPVWKQRQLFLSREYLFTNLCIFHVVRVAPIFCLVNKNCLKLSCQWQIDSKTPNVHKVWPLNRGPFGRDLRSFPEPGPPKKDRPDYSASSAFCQSPSLPVPFTLFCLACN